MVMPIGEVLAHSTIPSEFLNALAQDRLTGIRAISAVAQTYRYINNNPAAKSALNKLVRDHREEVRYASPKHSKSNRRIQTKLKTLSKIGCRLKKKENGVQP